jgi:Secretion system C-terminal sorting domain
MAQTYHSFLHDTAIWNEDMIIPGSCSVDFNSVSGFYRNLIMAGDTPINGRNYKKIYDQDYYSYTYIGGVLLFEQYNSSPPVLVGAVREDSLKRIYFLNFDSIWFDGFNSTACVNLHLRSNTELLLYDFNLNIGDSLPWKEYSPVVLSIDSIMAENGTYLRVFHFDSYSGNYWIEGLGSSTGLFGAYMPTPFECNCTLNCAQATEYLNPGQNPCGGIYTSVQQPSENSKLVVFPNPAHDKIIMNFFAQGNKPITISLLNELGQMVWMKNEEVVRGNLSEEISVSDFPDGIYFLQLKTENGVFNREVLVSR